jgi:hypothetical protein
MAQQWRQRQGMAARGPLGTALSPDSPPWLTTPTASISLPRLPQQTYTDRRFTSDHPALLGALGYCPPNRITNDTIMRRTLTLDMGQLELAY